MTCTICEKRKAVRFCPTKGEKICAVCCGEQREVTIDCASDCSYLVAAHRYEDEHRQPIPQNTSLLDVEMPRDIVYTQQKLIAALAFSVAKFCTTHPPTADPDVLAAMQALAKTHRTMLAGIFYENQPDAPLARELFGAIAAMLAGLQKQQVERGGSLQLKAADIFHVLVFLYRMGLLRSNGRPKSRRFIEFLPGQFPKAKELKKDEPRIIAP